MFADLLLLAVFAEELHDGGTVLGVVEGGDVAAGLVDHEVLGGLGAVEELAVDADMVAADVGAGAELGDGLAVYLDAAFEDDGLGGAAAGDAGAGEDLLQTLTPGGSVLGIGVAFNIYFVVAWRAGAQNLLQSSLTRAVIFSAATTATGFGTLWLSVHPGTASMGELLMISLFWTLVTTLFLSPALLGPPPPKTHQVDVPLIH